MAALNSPEGTLAEVFNSYFSSLPSLLCPPSLTRQQRSVMHKIVEYGGGMHAEVGFTFHTHGNFAWFQDRMVMLKLLYLS